MTKKQLITALVAATLAFPAVTVQARGTDNHKKATLAGAAAGAALGGILGNDGQSMLIGAAAGGLAGNAYAYHNKKMNQKDAEIERRDRWYRDSRYYDDWYDHGRYKRHSHFRPKKRHWRDWDDWDDWDD